MEASLRQHSEFLGVFEAQHAEDRVTNCAICDFFREALETLSRMSECMMTERQDALEMQGICPSTSVLELQFKTGDMWTFAQNSPDSHISLASSHVQHHTTVICGKGNTVTVGTETVTQHT